MDEKSEKTLPEEETLVVEKTNSIKDGKKRKSSPLGLILPLLSAMSLSLANVLARQARLFRGSEIAFMSYVLTFGAMMVIILVKGENPLGPREHRKINIIRSGCNRHCSHLDEDVCPVDQPVRLDGSLSHKCDHCGPPIKADF